MTTRYELRFASDLLDLIKMISKHNVELDRRISTFAPGRSW